MNSVVSNERWKVHGALVVAVIAISFAALFFVQLHPHTHWFRRARDFSCLLLF